MKNLDTKESNDRSLDWVSMLVSATVGAAVGNIIALIAINHISGARREVQHLQLNGQYSIDTNITPLGWDWILGLSIGCGALAVFTYVSWVKFFMEEKQDARSTKKPNHR